MTFEMNRDKDLCVEIPQTDNIKTQMKDILYEVGSEMYRVFHEMCITVRDNVLAFAIAISQKDVLYFEHLWS
jgi:hypothetical protein